jgi:hypothetical protein
MTPPEPQFSSSPFASSNASGLSTSRASESRIVQASVLSRAAAFVIDFGGTVAVTIGVVWLCVSLGFEGYNGTGAGAGNGLLLALGILAIVVIPLAAVIINVRLARTRRYSIGKFLTGIRLVDVNTLGPVTVGRLVKRVAILFVPGMLTLLALGSAVNLADTVSSGEPIIGVPSVLGIVAPLVWIAVLFPMLRGDGRGWQDTAAETRVVTAASVG